MHRKRCPDVASQNATITLTRQQLYDRAWTTPPSMRSEASPSATGEGVRVTILDEKLELHSAALAAQSVAECRADDREPEALTTKRGCDPSNTRRMRERASPRGSSCASAPRTPNIPANTQRGRSTLQRQGGGRGASPRTLGQHRSAKLNLAPCQGAATESMRQSG